MLTVRTFIAPSLIHGLGVYADEPIKDGTIVWIFNPIIDQEITTEEIETLPAAARDVVYAHAFLNHDGRLILSRDNAVFFNHSDRPNTLAEAEGNIAQRDIDVGEELTEDYRRFPLGACSEFLKIKQAK